MKRWTMKELKVASDAEILKDMVRERINSLPNPYTPLADRLNKIVSNLEKGILEKGSKEESVSRAKDILTLLEV